MAASHGQTARGLSEIVLGAFPLLLFIPPSSFSHLKRYSLQSHWRGSGGHEHANSPRGPRKGRAQGPAVNCSRLSHSRSRLTLPAFCGTRSQMSGSSEPGGRAALQTHKAFALARCRSRLRVRCALLPRLFTPRALWMQTRSHRTVLQRASKGSLLISPEEALSSVPCQGSGCSLRAGADLHPASQKCGEMGVIPPPKPQHPAWGMPCAGRRWAPCCKGCVPVPPVLRLPARPGWAAEEHSCGSRPLREAWGEKQDTPASHGRFLKSAQHYSSIIVHSWGVNYSLCNFYLT